jgi:hypothetical protein
MDQEDKSGIYLELLKKVLEKSEDTNNLVHYLRRDLDLHIQKTEFELEGIRSLDKQQNEILQEHHDRSIQLKRDNELREEALKLEIRKVDSRVAALEEPRKIIKTIGQWIIGLGALAGAIAAIYNLFS